MQDGLGALQDEVTFAKLVAEVLGEEAERPAGASVDREAALRKAVKASAAIEKAKPFW